MLNVTIVPKMLFGCYEHVYSPKQAAIQTEGQIYTM